MRGRRGRHQRPTQWTGRCKPIRVSLSRAEPTRARRHDSADPTHFILLLQPARLLSTTTSIDMGLHVYEDACVRCNEGAVKRFNLSLSTCWPRSRQLQVERTARLRVALGLALTHTRRHALACGMTQEPRQSVLRLPTPSLTLRTGPWRSPCPPATAAWTTTRSTALPSRARSQGA